MQKQHNGFSLIRRRLEDQARNERQATLKSVRALANFLLIFSQSKENLLGHRLVAQKTHHPWRGRETTMTSGRGEATSSDVSSQIHKAKHAQVPQDDKLANSPPHGGTFIKHVAQFSTFYWLNSGLELSGFFLHATGKFSKRSSNSHCSPSNMPSSSSETGFKILDDEGDFRYNLDEAATDMSHHSRPGSQKCTHTKRGWSDNPELKRR